MRKLLLFLALTDLIWSQTGNLAGLIRDATTHQPLIGVNVIISDTELGAASDMEGYFRIEKVPVGSYNIRISMIGYEVISRRNFLSKHEMPLPAAGQWILRKSVPTRLAPTILWP